MTHSDLPEASQDHCEPLDDVQRLVTSLELDGADALIPLADELEARGHPHSECLTALALLASQTTSFAVTAHCASAFAHIANLPAGEEHELQAGELVEKIQLLAEVL